MAIFRAGPLAAQISGSIAGQTFSHNKGGPYIRNRAIPTNPSTLRQQQARADLANQSTDWQNLTNAQRESWREWARQNPVINALGDSILLSGHMAFTGLNSRIALAGGTQILVPPVVSRPDGFTSVVQAGDIGSAAFTLTFAAALTSGNQVYLRGAVVNSAGIRYVKNLLRFVAFSAVDETSPWDNQTEIEAVLGTMVVGQTLHIEAAQYDPATGQVSTFLRDDVVITDTP